MSARDRKADLDQLASRLDALPPLPRDDDGPVFAEPWQAQAFALAVKLSEQGYFTWKEWASALADEIKAAAQRGEGGGCLAHLIFLRAQMLVATLRLRTRRSIVCSIRRELPRFV